MKRYADNTWLKYPDQPLSVGGPIKGGRFEYHKGPDAYRVKYWYAGNGVIAYNYWVNTDWETIEAATILHSISEKEAPYLDISKIFFQQCRARCVPLGFRRIRQTHARIVNDVLQTFTFKRYSSGRDCTVEFGIFPLCQEIPYPGLGIYTLCNFEVSTCNADWSYDRNSEASIEACVQNICSYIDRYLLPLFEEANCSEKALPALIALDTHFENVRQANLLQKNINDYARKDWRYYSLLKGEKFYMALKCGQYDYARKAAQILIPNRRPECKALYQSFIDHLDVGDTAYVEKILHEHEQKSLENLAQYRLMPITCFEDT